MLKNASFELSGNGTPPGDWSNSSGPIETYCQPFSPGLTSHDGHCIAEANSPNGGNVYQDITDLSSSQLAAGNSYDFSVWLRSPSGQPFNACVNLFALPAGSQIGDQQTCQTIGSDWTLLSAPRDIVQSGNTFLRAAVYLYTANLNLDMDGAQVVSSGLKNASFELSGNGTPPGDWSNSSGPIETYCQPFSPGLTSHDGHCIAEANSPNGGNVYQDITDLSSSQLAAGNSYDFSVWLRSPSGQPFNACVNLFALPAGSQIGDQQTCQTIGSDWTLLSAPRDIVQSGNTFLRAAVYLYTANLNLDMDGATLSAGNAQFGQTPPDPPTSVSAAPGAERATVSFLSPANDGDSPITGYAASCSSSNGGVGGSNTGSGSPIMVTGLTDAKRYTCTVTAANAVGPGANSTASNAVVVGVAPAITSPLRVTLIKGVKGTFIPTATGFPTPVITESGTLPANVTFAGGKLTGTSTVSGNFPITFTAHNGVGNDAMQKFTLTVVPIGITTTFLPAGKLGDKYSAALIASGGNKPYTWSLATGSKPLPPGLKLSSAGVISGTPTKKGNFSFTVKVVDTKTKTKPVLQHTATETLKMVVT